MEEEEQDAMEMGKEEKEKIEEKNEEKSGRALASLSLILVF
jgi:hypothetical protein